MSKEAREAVWRMNDPANYDPLVGNGHDPEKIIKELDRLDELEEDLATEKRKVKLACEKLEISGLLPPNLVPIIGMPVPSWHSWLTKETEEV